MDQLLLGNGCVLPSALRLEREVSLQVNAVRQQREITKTPMEMEFPLQREDGGVDGRFVCDELRIRGERNER